MNGRRCNSCKKLISLGDVYYICSVSTCQRGATNFAFCSIACWDAHVPLFRHKNASALERRLTSLEEKPEESVISSSKVPRDILIVASKLKKYVRLTANLNTSAEVLEVLSDKVRELTDRACRNAKSHGRKTLMARDF